MEFPFMRLRPLFFTTLLALLVVPSALFAEAEISSKEEERLAALARDNSEWYAPKSSLSVGFRVLASGVNVQFGKLGTVDFNTNIAPPSAGVGKRVYNNGTVDLDAPRATELDANGNQISTPGGRYQTTTTTTSNVTDAAGNVIGTVDTTTVSGDYLSYTPGLTRVWTYSTPDQALVRPGYIAMSSYSATSDGETRDKKQGPSGGVELQFAHIMGKMSKRTEWSLMAGITLNGINNKTAGDVHSSLNTKTDFYSLYGQTAPYTSPAAPYNGPSYTDLPDPSGGAIPIPSGLENTVPIGVVADNKTANNATTNDSVLTTTPGAATVHGKWQVKGAYYMVRVGPSVHSQLTERLGVSASLGLAGAYAGTHYTAVESMDVPGLTTTITNLDVASDETKFLGGYYADCNLDWAANETMGLFTGLSAQKFGDYGQALGSRTARIDIGTSVGIRGGINIKF
jgi:hypothetical protein